MTWLGFALSATLKVQKLKECAKPIHLFSPKEYFSENPANIIS